MTPCLLFDFDETLTVIDTNRLLVRAFWKVYPLRVLVAMRHLIALRRARGDFARQQAAKFRMFGTMLKGLRPADLEPVLTGYRDHVRAVRRSAVWQRMLDHPRQGATVAVVTASPQIAVAAAFGDLPVVVIGSEFQVRNGRYTGQLTGTGCYGDAKKAAILDWLDPQPQDLTITEAWSDSWSDAPMMMLAQRRYWICPPASRDQITAGDPDGVIFDGRDDA